MGARYGVLRCIAAGLACLAAAVPCAAAEMQPEDGLHTLPAELRLGAERLSLPRGEALGLVGTSYLLNIGQGVWFGPAAYGAISGRRGGLFTIGAEASLRHRLVGPLQVEAGLYAGGGGGGAAPVGGGLMWRPHADLPMR